MNVTDEPIVFYPRTKLGTFSPINPHYIRQFDASNEDTSIAQINSIQTDVPNKMANESRSTRERKQKLLSQSFIC